MKPRFRHSGIRSKVLLELVRNTAPFVFQDEAFLHHAYGKILRIAVAQPPDESDLYAYFDLCLASHFATVGTFVPTDVDLAIREKLWSGLKDPIDFLPMWRRVRDSLQWDESPVSRRFVGEGRNRLSGHQGEWLTVAMGAYATALRISPEMITEIREAIESEVKREECVIMDLKEKFLGDPAIETMKAYLFGVAAVVHNLGDLDRMFDAFGLEDSDGLKREVYRGAHEDSRCRRKEFLVAGEVYQKFLASENHRHFALRAPKPLRKSADFLLPFGPFFDDWGDRVIRVGFQSKVFSEGDLREILDALVFGWKKLNEKSIFASQGYARSICGMTQALGGRDLLCSFASPGASREINESGLKTLIRIHKGEFEKKFLEKVLSFLKD